MRQPQLQRIVWIVTVCIVTIGLLAVYSATHENVRVSYKIFYDQLLCALVGLGVVFVLSRFDYHRFINFAYILYGLNLILLIIVLAAGRYILGARRWIEVGSLNLQPSELTKLIIILMLARYFSGRASSFSFYALTPLRRMFRDLLWPLILTGIPMFLIFKQPDLGTALLLLGIFLTMLFIAGIRYAYLFGLMGAGVLMAPVFWHMLRPYQKERLAVFLNPNADPLGAGYTIIQSKIAIGSGEILGKGWFSGTQNQLNFLPERHTDFIFSVIGEEWGFLGACLLLMCFFILINCGFKIAQQSYDRFGFLVAAGIVGLVALQVVVNIGMVLGLCPVVGLTLPFVSYGRSSFLVFAMMIGILLNVSRPQKFF